MAHQWTSDRSVFLQLQEVGATPQLLQSAADPDLAKRLVVALCVVRQDPALDGWVREQLEGMQGFTPFRTWFLNLLYDVRHNPQDLPFCLTDQEFRYYARTLFGDTIGDLDGVYHPPNFYVALVEDVVGVGLGMLAARYIPNAIPSAAGAAAGAQPGLAVAGGRAELGAASGGIIAHILPGGSLDAAKKSILWPRYEADYRRRTGQ